MSWASSAVNQVWRASSFGAYSHYMRALRSSRTYQDSLLKSYLRENEGAEFGKQHHFGKIRSYEEFRRRVPVRGYDEIESWMESIQAGENNVLSSDRVMRLVPTSGSCSAAKLIPFTQGLQREFNRAIAAWTFDLFTSNPHVAKGPAYWSISPAVTPRPDSSIKVPVGFEDDSAYLGGWKQTLVRQVMAVSDDVRFARSIEEFRYLTLLALLRCKDLALISVWHPSFLTLLLGSLPIAWENLLEDIDSGGCRVMKEKGVTNAFRGGRGKKRAAELRSIGPKNPQAIWPCLAVISCWGDGHAELLLPELERLFPGVKIQRKGLLATEAFVSIPFRGKHPLAITSHFFEFLDDEGNCWPTNDLKMGHEYEVVVTTGGGLWRYRLGDRVRVEDYLLEVPCIRFLGRNAGVSDLCGEKLSDGFVAKVFAEVISRTGIRPNFMMAAPGSRSCDRCYTVFTDRTVFETLGAIFEEGFCRSPGYAYARQLGQLGPVKVRLVEANASELYLQRELKEGKVLGNIKIPALSARSGWEEYFEVPCSKGV